MPQPARLRIELRTSPRLALLLAVAHALTAAMVLVLPLPLWVRVALLGALAVSLVRSARRHALRGSPHACTALEVHRDGSTQWWLRSGTALTGRVLGESFVSPFLTVVALRRDDNGRRAGIVLLPDSSETDALRALRVWLRFKVEIE
ncbi:MAG: protein YgfX [Burkholderiales bacterium]